MKEVVAYVVSSHGYSERRACRVTRQHRSTQRTPSTRDPRTELRQRMHEIVATRIRYGYRRVHVMLRREGWQVGRNVVYHHGVRIDFSRPGYLTYNARIETFNGSYRDECLNVHWFASLPEAKRLIEAWRREYNDSRPHMALGNLTPAEYLAGSGYCPTPIGVGQAGN